MFSYTLPAVVGFSYHILLHPFSVL